MQDGFTLTIVGLLSPEHIDMINNDGFSEYEPLDVDIPTTVKKVETTKKKKKCKNSL